MSSVPLLLTMLARSPPQERQPPARTIKDSTPKSGYRSESNVGNPKTFDRVYPPYYRQCNAPIFYLPLLVLHQQQAHAWSASNNAI
jgi:hypothetical protein